MYKNIKILILIFLVIVFSSYLSYLNSIYQLDFFFSELGILEILQVLVLLWGLILLFKNFLFFKNRYEKKFMYIRIFSFIFLIYEEISFITKGFFTFADNYNIKSELNLHNSKFLLSNIFENIPFFDDVIFDTFIIATILIFLGLGSFTKLSSKLKIIFVEKELFFIAFLYPLHILLNNLINFYKINIEFIEFALYFLVAYDILLKKKKITYHH